MRKKAVILKVIETARLIFDQIFPFLRVSLPKILFSNKLTGMFNIIAIKIPIKIGDNVKIGAGAVVLKNVEAGTTVVGVPSNRIIRK